MPPRLRTRKMMVANTIICLAILCALRSKSTHDAYTLVGCSSYYSLLPEARLSLSISPAFVLFLSPSVNIYRSSSMLRGLRKSLSLLLSMESWKMLTILTSRRHVGSSYFLSQELVEPNFFQLSSVADIRQGGVFWFVKHNNRNLINSRRSRPRTFIAHAWRKTLGLYTCIYIVRSA